MIETEALQADGVDIDPQGLRASALRQARWLVSFYGITAEELSGPPALAQALGVCDDAPATAPRAVKYRHPLTGETWDGEGPHPDWLRQALLKDGYRVAELRVDDWPAAGASSPLQAATPEAQF